MRRVTAVALLMMMAATLPGAQGHGERYTEFPPGIKTVPEYRETGPYFVTCKDDTPARLADASYALRIRELLRWNECQDNGYEHLQAAVDAVPARGWRIFMQPGLYLEEPSVEAWENPPPGCEGLSETKQLDSYDQHIQCPHAHNTVAILGDRDGDRICGTSDEEVLCDLQIEGTGVSREDVIVDAQWRHLNAIRVDRADGFYVKHITAQRTDFNAIYILETDGFVIDDVLTRWNYEYGFLTFAVDHGLYTDCESYGNGDSGIYPGSASDLKGVRHSIEIRFCDSHHNLLGYSGTAGNSVWAHHNVFHHNTAGVAMDSLFPDHPGLPQDSARFEKNWIFSNNENYHNNWLPGGPCHNPLPERGIENGTVCPVVPVPVGTGFLIAGGNSNRFIDNHIWDNWRTGGMLFGVPAFFRGEHGGFDVLCAVGADSPESFASCFADADPQDLAGDAGTQFDTSHDNWFVDNTLGVAPDFASSPQSGALVSMNWPFSDGQIVPNGRDWWWDEAGQGNCWQGNQYGPEGERIDVTDPQARQPSCGEHAPADTWRPPHPRLATIVPCDEHSEPENTHPEGCDWMNDPEAP